MPASFSFDEPEHFTAGAVGAPGDRTFYVQVAESGQLATFKIEKMQVAAIARYLIDMLSDLAEPATPLPSAPELIEPLVAEWTVGEIAIAYEPDVDRVLLVLHETGEAEEPDTDEPQDVAAARLRLSRLQAAAFIGRVGELLAAGRPICMFCGEPMDPGGHRCPRWN